MNLFSSLFKVEFRTIFKIAFVVIFNYLSLNFVCLDRMVITFT